MKYSCLIFLGFITVWKAPAQEFKIKALLQPVETTGFYQLTVSPELSALSRSDLSDIRILDQNQKQVPYIVRTSSGVSIQAPFVELPIKSILTDSIKTSVQIEAERLKEISTISLLIGNNAVERFSSISGSNDQQSWYIIDERIGLRNNGSIQGGYFVQSLQFPLVTYKYLKLDIFNGKSDPLNIIKAGVYDISNKSLAVYSKNPPSDMRQKDSSNGNTYVFVQNRQPFMIDQVYMSVKGPPFYKREARLYVPGKQAASKNTIHQFLISSERDPVFQLDGNHYPAFVIEIENGDSPPLTIENIVTSQLQKTIILFLESGKQYTLLTGNPDATLPRYDLNLFNDSIPRILPAVNYGEMIQNTSEEVEAPFQTRSILWFIIAAGILVLGFLSYRLMHDLKHQRSS